MIRQIPPQERQSLSPLFFGIEETPIWSVLEGRMGDAWAEGSERPCSARVTAGDFVFLGGDGCCAAAEELVRKLPERKEGSWILVPCAEGWEQTILKVWSEQVQRGVRYAIRKEPDAFDRKKLLAISSDLPEGVQVVPIDQRLYHSLLKEDWSRDFCSNFQSWEDYRQNGLGYIALWKGRPVSGASSYTAYSGGIEIEVDTLPEYRRKGLAAACCARLILSCLDEGRYPSWDAANSGSVALAEHLGYRFSHEYPVFFLTYA